MTISELINELSKLNKDLKVFVNSGEYGYDDITIISKIFTIALNQNNEHWEGSHEIVEQPDFYQNSEKVQGIIIS